ncbi:MAG: thermonuclease family protein [Burkholderiaceae bacterium]|jgi:endonuclease YncB( thermonuclease family)|nr:thermonuclease family protein [Burkholderiaceae bacterium]
MKKLILIFILFLSNFSHAKTIEGLVVGVADGDTITVLDQQKNTYKIRLQGIDAPEKKQAFGEKSKQSLHDLVHRKQVRIEYDKEDKYGRIVGKVTVDDVDVCLQQLVLGMAWHYKKYQNEQSVSDRALYSDTELKSKSLKLGLWTEDTPMPPWEFRKK